MMIADLYERVSPGDSESGILNLLGSPTCVDDTRMPKGSGFGLQEGRITCHKSGQILDAEPCSFREGKGEDNEGSFPE